MQVSAVSRTGARGAIGLVVAATLALAGCSRPAPSTSPEPTTDESPPAASYLCTPEGGGAPTPCTPEQFTEQERMTVLYGEAEKVFRKWFGEKARLFRAGGTDRATPIMVATTGGPYQAAELLILKDFAAKGLRAEGGDIKLAKVSRAPGAASYGYEVALTVCIDARSVEIVQQDKPSGKQGSATAGTVYFKRDGDQLKAWDAQEKVVKSC